MGVPMNMAEAFIWRELDSLHRSLDRNWRRRKALLSVQDFLSKAGVMTQCENCGDWYRRMAIEEDPVKPRRCGRCYPVGGPTR